MLKLFAAAFLFVISLMMGTARMVFTDTQRRMVLVPRWDRIVLRIRCGGGFVGARD